MQKKNYNNKVINVGILVFDDVEVLDFTGPFEVFSVARQDGEGRDGKKLFNVFVIAEKNKSLSATGGLHIKPNFTIGNHPKLDILIIPGGWGTRREKDNKVLVSWIKKQNKKTEITASVCTGAFLLAEAGLLDKKKTTTHWASIEWMKETYPKIKMLSNYRFVDEEHIITSAGISAGIDMSLYIVAKRYGKKVAIWTAKRMEYDIKEDSF